MIDARWRGAGHRSVGRQVDLASCSRAFTGEYLDEEPILLTALHTRDGGSEDKSDDEPSGEFIGLIKLSTKGAETVKRELLV